jgi:hypothetical protein
MWGDGDDYDDNGSDDDNGKEGWCCVSSTVDAYSRCLQ